MNIQLLFLMSLLKLEGFRHHIHQVDADCLA